MREWKRVRIGDLIDSVTTWNPSRLNSGSTFSYIDISSVDQDSKKIVGARELLCSEAPSRARQLVVSGDILVSTVRPNLNSVARVPIDLDGATASTGFCALRSRQQDLDPSYLFHWVKTPLFIQDMMSKATGASYPAVSDRIILESSIPLPPLPEQRRIAAILDKAESLRALRRAALEKLEGMAGAIFLEMFGESQNSGMSLPLKSLKQVGKVITGSTPPSALPGMFNGDFPFITPGDLESSSEVKRTLTEAGAAKSRTVPSGSALVCCIGATIGKMMKAPTQTAFNQQINAVQWGPEIDSDYGIEALRTVKGQIILKGASTTLPILKKSAFEMIEIPVAPMEMQQRFAERVMVIEQMKAAASASQNATDALFQSLQHRAFRGEL